MLAEVAHITADVMARELLTEKVTLSLAQKHDHTPRYRRTRSSSSQRQYFVVDRISDDDFRTYRKFSADADSHSGGQGGEGIVTALLRRCRSRSNSRSGSRRRVSVGDDDDDDDVVEHIELSQFGGFPLSRLSDVSDAGHNFVTVYVAVPVWCDRCGQLIIGVYGHYVLCQCEYFTAVMQSSSSCS